MEYLKIWTSFRESISPLNDAEKGRLFDAMLLYAETGELPDFKGNERYIWPTAKQAIDRAAQKAETLRQNGNKGGRPPKPNETKENQAEPNETKENQAEPTYSIKKRNNKKNIKEDKEENAHAQGPFGLTDEEINSSLARDQQIEDAARSAGLPVSEVAMVTAREHARAYGLDKLLDAIRQTAISAQKPSWAYVEGILKGNGGKQGGTAPEHRGNRGGDHGEVQRSGKFDYLFTNPA